MLVLGHLSNWYASHQTRLRFALNAVVTIGLGYALYRQFFVANDLPSLVLGFRQNLPPAFWLTLVGVTALMPVNLALEAYKLRVALPQNLQAPWRQTLGQICGGIAVGLWTPGRVGEFAGRLAGTRAEQRAPMLSATALGGIAQWSPLLIGGGLALWFWREATELNPGERSDSLGAQLQDYLHGASAVWIGGAAIGVGILTAVLFWRSTHLLRWVKRRTLPLWLSRIIRDFGLARLTQTGFLSTFEDERVDLLLASVARYLVYLLQMSLTFVAFGLPVGVVGAVVGTATLLLLHGFLPVPPALQAMARIEFAVLLFGYANPNEVSIAAASLFIFALNLGLPALYGWLFIVRRNVKNDSPTEA